MELHLVPGLRGPVGGGGGGGTELDRLTEAEQLLRRTRQRLEELAERLAELRRKIGDGKIVTTEPGAPDPSGGGQGRGGERDVVDAQHPVADEPASY